jgi:hypothetical protein
MSKPLDVDLYEYGMKAQKTDAQQLDDYLRIKSHFIGTLKLY